MPSKEQLADWGYGDPDADGYYQDHIATFTAGGLTLTCHEGLVPIFTALIEGIEANGYELEKGIRDDWGYANRDIRGVAGVKSWHSVGGAIDLDATKNPMGVKKTTFPIRKTQRLAKDLGLTWGYNWTERPDPMHFEAAHPLPQMRLIASRLRKHERNDEGEPEFPGGVLTRGDYGDAVKWIQRRLKALDYYDGEIDGRYSQALNLAVRRFQDAKGLVVTGEVTRSVWNTLR